MTATRAVFAVAAAALAAATAAALAGTGAEDARRDAARVDLGRQLFFDPAASRTGRFACSTCHDPEHGFSEKARISRDEFRESRRHAQTVADLAAFPAGTKLHWDGEFDGVRDLLAARLLPIEESTFLSLAARFRAAARASRDPDALDETTRAALTSSGAVGYGSLRAGPHAFPDVSVRLSQHGLYRQGFLAAFGSDEVTLPRTYDALEAYLASVRTARNAFDRHLAGERDAMPADARRGLDLFEGKARCSTCHATSPSNGRAPLADGKFHDTGIAERCVATDPGRTMRNVNGHFVDGGRGEQTLLESDRMTFRTPSLRDVARRGPYMHDGSFPSLKEVVDYYDAGGTPHPGLSPHVRRIGLTPAEKSDLVAFLESLTGEERAGLADPPSDLGRETAVRVVDLAGKPLARAAISVSPAGERFRGVPVPKELVRTTTDAEGRARFRFPPTTHARLATDEHALEGGRLLPLGVDDVTFVAVPRGKVAVRALVPEDLVPETIEVQNTHGQSSGKPDTRLEWVRWTAPGEALYAGDSPGAEGWIMPEVNLRAMRGKAFLIGRTTEMQVGSGALGLLDLRLRSDVIRVRGRDLEIEMRRDLSAREIEEALRKVATAKRDERR